MAKAAAVTPAKAAAILAERRLKDPCYQFRRTTTQEAFHRSRARFRMLSGGNRSGKTATSLVELAALVRGLHPHRPWFGPVIAMVFCVSRQQAAMVVQRKLLVASEIPGVMHDQPMIPSYEINWEESGSIKVGFRVYYVVALKNGSLIYFSWADSEETAKRIQGVKADIIYIDEAAGDRNLVVECLNRLKDSITANRGGWSGCMWWGATGTMINEGFEEYRNRCMNPMEPDWEYFQIRAGENPAVSAEANELVGGFMTEEEKAIRLAGDSTAGELVQIYGRQWRDDRHLHKPDYEPSPEDNLWLGYDPGMDHPTGLMIAAINRDAPLTLNVVWYLDHFRKTMDEDAAALAAYLRGRRLAGVVYDTVMNNTDKRGASTLTLMQESFAAAGITPLCGYFAASKRHAQGIALVRHYLDPDPYHDTVPPLIRVNASEASGCQKVRYQLLAYRGREATRFTGKGGVVKKDDEAPDVLRYLVMKRPAWNKDWACLGFTHINPSTPGPPIPLPSQPPEDMTPYQRQLQLSRQRRKPNRGIAQIIHTT